MTEVVVEPSTVEDDKGEQDAFNKAFEPTPTAEKPPVEVQEPEKTEPEKPDVPKAEDPPKPEYVQITKDDLARLNTSASQVSELQTTLQKLQRDLPGRIGGVEGLVKELQAKTAAGEVIEITEEDLSDLQQNWPELKPDIAKVFNKVFAKLKTKGTATVEETAKAPAFDPKALDAAVDAKVKAVLPALRLTVLRPDWASIVGPDPRDVPGVTLTPFRQWLAKQPADYQAVINDTDDPATIHAAIDTFQESMKPPPAPKPNTRHMRMENAVPPKTVPGRVESKDLTEEEAFLKTVNQGA